MKDALRYGIIGCGSMGREHMANIHALGGHVTAIADPHAASRDAAVALARQPFKTFEHHQPLLDSGLCDVVVIASPNFTHIDVMRAALGTEMHILVEKPLVTTMADGIELVERAKARKNGIVWVAQEYRYMPPVARMIRMAHEGAVGVIHQVSIREHREPFYPKVGDWNRFSANTGGTLVEKCCHYFNLMDFILNEKPTRVFASGGQRVNHLDERYGGKTPDILDSAYVIVEYGSGARAMLDLCMFAESTVDKENIVVIGDQGKLESLLPTLTLRYGRRDDWGQRNHWGTPGGEGNGVSTRHVWDSGIRYPGQHFGASYLEHVHFAHAIQNGLPSEITIEDGLRAVATGLAAHRSIDEGRVVAMSDVLPPGW